MEHFVIIGGGLAGASAIDTLLKSGFGGKITLVSKENTLPYDRTILSKNINVKDQYIHVKNKEYFDKHGVNLIQNTQADEIN